MNVYNNNNPYLYGYQMPQYQRPAAQQTEAPVAPQFIAPQMNYIKGRPVVSIDEARASSIDLDGSLYVFPDLGNKKIYTKQINMDGTASFNVFELVVQQEPAREAVYVTKDELDKILTAFKASLVETKTPEPSAAQVKQSINKTFNL